VPATRRSLLFVHAAAGLGFFALAVWMSYPLIRHLATHVPGAGSSEDLKFLWNFYWFRTAPLARPFECPLVFAPFGISLALDTHIALPAMIGATVLRSVDVIVASNILVLAGLTLNGWLAFALAYRHVRRALPAALAGLIFANSAYLAIHLLGHFNLIHAWTLVLVVLVWEACLRRPAWTRAVWLGGAFAIATYTDYYYTVYGGVFVMLWWLATAYVPDWRVTRRPRPSMGAIVAVAAAWVCLLLLILAIARSGGFDLPIGRRTISFHSTRNLRTALWALAAAAACMRWRIALVMRPHPAAAPIAAVGRLILAALAVYGLLMLPLERAALTLAMSGDFVNPGHHWLSDPGGIDLATVFLGHPLHTFLWPSVQRAYSVLGINMIEETAWLGVVPLLLLGVAIQRRGVRSLDRRWLTIGLVFFVWALGPFLRVAGRDTALILPDALLRYLPVISNAHIPGRALVVAQLATAMVCAGIVIQLNLTRMAIAAVAALVVLDSLTLPFQLDRVPTGGTVEQTLASPQWPAGAVLEVPMGVADGFGDLGRLDFRSLAWQMRHGRPITGGFAARVPDRIKRAYTSDPILGRILRMSAGASPAGAPLDWQPAEGSRHLIALGVRFVVINRDTAPPAAVTFVLDRLSLRPLARDGQRELYAIQE
jgi:hypothetical protein